MTECKRTFKMPTKPKSKSKKVAASETESPEIDPGVGLIEEELEVPVASEVVFRKIWRIRKFHKTISRRDSLDSPRFRCAVNGLATTWSVSVRFWKGPNGKKITNPVVVCLNLVGCETGEAEGGQARVRFQLGVWDASIRHWECCPIAHVVLNLSNTRDLLSVGYKSLGIVDRHIDPDTLDANIMVKLQIIQSDEEVHSLSQDMARLYLEDGGDKDVIVECTCCRPEGDGDASPQVPLRVHSWIIRARCTKLANSLDEYTDANDKALRYKLDLGECARDVVVELLRYLYTDKVEGAESLANRLLPLAIRLHLPGLTALCERSLLESLTPTTVANVLLLADRCGCEALRKAALHYCEHSDEIKESVSLGGKTLAWRVMEMVNPDLFQEACESICSSSSNLDSPGTPGSWSE